MRRLSFLGVLLSVFVLLVFSTCSETETLLPKNELIEAEKANAVVPFKGTFVTHPVPVGGIPGYSEIIYIISEGKATHLGNSTWEAPETEFIFVWDPVCMGFPQSGPMTFTAANGDQLTGELSGCAVFGTPGVDPFFTMGDGSFTIDGGNGRFTGYTGTGTYHFSVGVPVMGQPLEGSVEFIGTLTKP